MCVTRRWQQTPTRSRATLTPTHARVHLLSRGVRPLAAIYQPVVSRRARLRVRAWQTVGRCRRCAAKQTRDEGADAQKFARAAAEGGRMTLPATAAAAASRVFTLSRPTSYSPGRNLARGHPSHDESGNSDFLREELEKLYNGMADKKKYCLSAIASKT